MRAGQEDDVNPYAAPADEPAAKNAPQPAPSGLVLTCLYFPALAGLMILATHWHVQIHPAFFIGSGMLFALGMEAVRRPAAASAGAAAVMIILGALAVWGPVPHLRIFCGVAAIMSLYAFYLSRFPRPVPDPDRPKVPLITFERRKAPPASSQDAPQEPGSPRE